MSVEALGGFQKTSLKVIPEEVPQKSQKKNSRRRIPNEVLRKIPQEVLERFPEIVPGGIPIGVSRGVLEIVGIQVGIQDEGPDRISEEVLGGILE